MSKQIDLDGLEAARRMAALSPETERRFEKCMSLGWTGPEQVTHSRIAESVFGGVTRTMLGGSTVPLVIAR